MQARVLVIKNDCFEEITEQDIRPPKLRTMKRYLLTIVLGIIGMFAAHFLLFILSAGLRLNYMPYIIVYPLVYVSLVFPLTRNKPAWWFSNAVCILIIPFIYWYWLLWSDGKFHLWYAVTVTESSGMLMILPLTFILTIVVSYYVFVCGGPVHLEQTKPMEKTTPYRNIQQRR